MSEKSSLLKKLKSLASDSAWTIAALVLMNCVAQFMIYPIWGHIFSDDVYGNIIYVMSLVNTFAVSIGIATNYARMSESARRKTRNGDYNRLLLICSVLSGVLCVALILLSDLNMSPADCLLAALLSVFTMWRYYADVEYRLALDYKGYFKYYAIISAGYLLGAGLFWVTGLWPLALLPGELLGLGMVYAKGRLFKDNPLQKSPDFSDNARTVLVLIVTNIISNAIFNGDRFVLQLMLNGAAVTVYYLSSLVGKTMSLITTPLNSVIIGYLARYEGSFTRRMVHVFTLITIAGIILGTLVGIVGSHILVRLLYPDNYAAVKAYFLLANMAQVIYFVTNIVTTILLRIANRNYQLVVNIVYAAAFLVLCLPATYFGGIDAFCIALLGVNVIRYLVGIVGCYRSVKRRS